MRRRIFVYGTALLLGLGITACATTPESSVPTDETMIQVENNNSLLVRVEALSDGIDYDLGRVETSRTQSFELPDAVGNALDLRLRVDPIGSTATYVSDEIIFTPGDLIRVEVEQNLNFTTVTVG